MQHLTPVGLTEDGRSLILLSDTGEEYVVSVDLKFRTALRGDNARHGQVEMKMESALRPRDIQARIRAGESAEDVAAAAQTTVDAIMAFAGPVLAERAHVAQTALKASIRRRTNETTPAARTLDEASRQHFATVGVRADDVSWDAWRRDDGRWVLVGTYAVRGTEHQARFTYDQPGRYVVADDVAAQILTGEAVPAPESAPESAPVSAATPLRRLSSVPADDELPLGDDALQLVRGPQPPDVEAPPSDVQPAAQPELGLVEAPTPEEHTEDLTTTAAAVRGASVRETADPTFEDLVADHADADWIAEPVPQKEEPELELDTEPAPPAPTDEQPEEPSAAEEPPPAEEQPKSRKKGRSSVPSWDEIMFGGGGGREQ